jgi:hypothetical protein
MRLVTDRESYFRMQVEAGDTGRATLKIYGELDIVSMAEFETHLASGPVREAHEITFDISDAHFISAHAFATIGQCSLWAERVIVRSRTTLASKVLKAFGYDRPVCIMVRD